ncbi:hypothetical protein ACW5F0_08410 [Luteimonas sp. A534]
MMLDAGVLLAMGLVAFYVQDSSQLLYVDEIVVVGTRRGWRFRLGSLELGGRFLHVPNPLLPARAMFRANWLEADRSVQESPAGLSEFVAELVALGRCCVALCFLLLVALPAAILAYRVPSVLLAILGCAYAVIALMLALLARRRRRLGLSGRDVVALGIGALLCPPHAINLVRKVCLVRGLRGDPLAFAARTLAAADGARLRKGIEARIDLVARADDSAIHVDGMRAQLGHVRETLP